MKKNSNFSILFFASILQLVFGIIYVWSVFVAPVSAYYSIPINEVKLTSSFMLSFFVLGILLGGKWQKKINVQNTVRLGGVLLSLGILLSALLPQSLGKALYFTYGMLSGFGVGMGYNAIISTIQAHFSTNCGLATGISVCAFGFSTVLFTPLINWLLNLLGLRNTFLTLSVLFLISTLVLAQFIPQLESNNNNSSKFDDGTNLSPKEMLHTTAFYLITLSMMLGTAFFFILNPSFKTLALSKGLSEELATVMIMLTGIGNACGRLFFAWFSDKTTPHFAISTILLLTAVCGILLWLSSGIIVIVFVVLIAFCYGGTSGVYPLVTSHYFGIKNIGANYGCVMVGFASSALLFPFIFRNVSFNISAVILSILALLGMFLLQPIKNWKA